MSFFFLLLIFDTADEKVAKSHIIFLRVVHLLLYVFLCGYTHYLGFHM